MTGIVHKHTGINYAKKGSLELGDEAAAAVQKTANRVSLDSIKAKITRTEYIGLEWAPHMTICVLQLENGFMFMGKSAPADPLNFDAELGKKFAYEDAVRQIWPMEAYLLREKMAKE